MKYNYSKTSASHFSGSVINYDLLTIEIKDQIETTHQHIGSSEDDVDFYFSGSLTSDEEDVLDSIVSSHDGEDYEFEDRYEVHDTVNAKGHTTKIIWYSRKVSDVYSLPVRQVEYVYDTRGNKLISEDWKEFDISGEEIDSWTFNWFTDKQTGKVMKEKIKNV